MKRREFITILSGAAAWPLAARAQPPDKPPTVAIVAGDVTGLPVQETDLASERIELLREVVPRLRRLAIMADAGYSYSVREAGDVAAAARAHGLDAVPVEIRRDEDIAPAFEPLRAQADALYVVSDALTAANLTPIITFALNARVPTILSSRAWVKAGGLMSYGPNYAELFRRNDIMVDKILHGTKPGDIADEPPAKLELVVNLKTAKALGITLPLTLLGRADEVIE